MGLDTTHDAFHGGYGSYTTLREALLIAAGYKVDDKAYPPMCIWDDDTQDIDSTKPEWDRARLGEIDRDEWPWDPIIYLWAHEDCDGIIKPAMAGAIADRIEELLPKIQAATLTFAPAWADSTRGRTTTTMASQFLSGLREASLAGEDVEFM